MVQVKALEIHPRDFKFIHDNVSWNPGDLEKELERGRWLVCAAPVDLLVQQNPPSIPEADLWAILYSALSHADTACSV